MLFDQVILILVTTSPLLHTFKFIGVRFETEFTTDIKREREIGICIFKYELTSSFKKVLFQIVLIL